MSPQQQPTQQQSRIDLADLKGQIVKKIGQDRALKYFSCLNRLLSQKLSKAEFDKLCRLTLGRENLALHNQLIRSILKNACDGRAPPPIPKRISKSGRVIGKRPPAKEDGCLPIGATLTPNSTLTIGSNEDALPLSPCELRSGICERRLGDPQSEAFGSNGEGYVASNRPRANEEGLGKSIVDTGDPYPCDLQRPMQCHQGFAEQPSGKSKWNVSLPPPNRRSQIMWSSHEQYPVHSRGSGLMIVGKDGEEMKQNNSANSGRIVLQAPLGISFFHANRDGGYRALPVSSSSSSHVTSFVDSGQLSDTETLRKRMEQIAGVAGLDGVSLDCANLLNESLDVYLKLLIRSCIEIVGARSAHKRQPHGKLINGVTPGHQMNLQSSNGILEVKQGAKSHCPISFLDFKVAMELNTQQLGKDWPRLLEKICLHTCEE